MIRTAGISAALIFLNAATLVPRSRAQVPKESHVYVVLWFDTEDYILPNSDDAAKRLALFLTQQGIRATFKVVGEKGRTLERRGRSDVIGALSQHEIGYHSNLHSQHPTVAEYESSLDWEAGAEEFTRRERPGYEDLHRIFGKTPTCYGQPGASWAPQVFPALKEWGVRVYLDEADHVGLDGQPFWYGGLLNIFNTRDGPQLRPNNEWSNVEDAKAKFQSFYTRLMSRPGGGLISLYYHPCEFVHREFWDATNFAEGANPPRQQWKLPPVKSPEESERAFGYFEQLVLYMMSFPRVRFVTASQALDLFPDASRRHVFSTKEISEIARDVSPQVTFQTHQGYALSASEVLSILNTFVSGIIRRKGSEPVMVESTPYGPDWEGSPGDDSNGQSTVPASISWAQFSRTVLDVSDFITKNHAVPSTVWFGSVQSTPEAYLLVLAQAAQTLIAKAEPPENVTLTPARLDAARYVAHDSPQLWSWPIFPRDFHSQHLMELARLQAWTLKPALLTGSQ